MSPAILLPTPSNPENRPKKRVKWASLPPEEESIPADAIPPHPLGLKPGGNAYTSPTNSKSKMGYFRCLPDEMLMGVLEILEAGDLMRLGGSCRQFYAFARAEELWRALFVASHPEDFRWLGTWRRTFLQITEDRESRIPCPDVFSDVLYRPFHCAYVNLNSYTADIPRGNEIKRMEDLTQEEYAEKWSDKPFILTSPVKQWPIYKKWTPETLLETYASVKFRAEAVDWPLSTYISYTKNSHDESPLYLFDCSFAEKMDLKIGRDVDGATYWPPRCFGEDLFTVLNDERPDSRWLIIGPARGGSTFHKDPNATSAWNAPLTGSKYWLMFPSGPNIPPPPGVIVSEDASEVTSPLSIAEYMLTFHSIARATPGCKEGICHAGEVLHVPSGWFHLVLNLEDSIALTQNFVPRRKVGEVLRFLRDSVADQISGFRDEVVDPYGLFVERLGEKYPEILEEGLKELEEKSKGGRGRWEELTKAGVEESEGAGFSFGFGFGDDDDDADIP
ncbi:hypothetical protein Vi05172_g796 [Venturia inaequalis]|uniref:Uncharacterized protein n=2 Tax=Venturia inaequalis TaxID=5025 RepID=A0A8H3UPD6_VENIN|nr:hypothetical protein EG327_008721 [Venturia inaequalis]RDI89715.1 hypothetical protein Vi05172_g796 [Venturia inaequalis]